MLSKTETADDYAFLFETIKDLSQKIFGHVFQIEILLADAAQAITNGFIKVFGNPRKRIVCWSHVEKKIEENIKGVSNINSFFSYFSHQWMSEHMKVMLRSIQAQIMSMDKNIKQIAI